MKIDAFWQNNPCKKHLSTHLNIVIYNFTVYNERIYKQINDNAYNCDLDSACNRIKQKIFITDYEERELKIEDL